MARILIPTDASTDSGVTLSIDTAADLTDGNYFVNSGNEILIVDNEGASSVTITVDYVADVYGRDGSKVVTVPATTQMMIGPFVKELYNQPGEQVFVNASAACNLCVIKK